ncbi:glutathione-dependent formaldehyde-activating enzyme [Hirsutella rhossiliensis]|uniref:Glutathione-dependent formaldehyde-activating enzyme domain-containing protein n=1 Tax=Hirsutella rhossiliensis TaxID=111463 RepID=A0A9P8N0B5_9HYPO|nr:glutathione-dependent formaldehyde-activating enzyme domain-containing protein [Hirsutella rhossiliensis]KAH0962412.1 glutathione-dependent formaldehyde-activating enzyme domain-containing protein [Hirsutella rhossiliensis]
MADSENIQTLEAKCFCGSIHMTFDVPVSSLPFAAYLCHCSMCRYATGSPCIFHTQLPVGLLPKFVGESTEDKLSSYTAKGADCSYDFCSMCGCHIGGVSLDRRQWTMATSIFKDHGPDKFQIKYHVFSKSAKGRGLASIVTRLGDREVKTWNPPDDDPRAALVTSEAETGDDGQDRLRAQCHCGGVSFTVRRPTKQVLDDPFVTKFVSPLDKKKWMAVFDACDDCRLTSGSHVVGWAFVPLSVCEPPIDPKLTIGTAKSYSSSEGALRSFCGTCGATLFFTDSERRPSREQAVVDIATGIIRAPEGVMAEDWLTWRTRVAFASSGVSFDKDFGEALSEGMKRWTRESYGEEVDFEVG